MLQTICRLFGEEADKQRPAARAGLGSVEYDSQQQQEAGAQSLPPTAYLTNKPDQQQQLQQADAITGTDNALLASSEVRSKPTVPSKEGSTGSVAAAGAASSKKAAAADADLDPLHDNLTDSEKEAEQLSALSRVIQQQQDTISKQVTMVYLHELSAANKPTRACSRSV
jgi:hypothetical protein